MKNLRTLAIALPLALAAGCGGGSGSASISGLTGTWRGTLGNVLDQCLIGVNPLTAVHQISVQGGLDVTLVSDDGRTFTGQETAADSFTVEIGDYQSFPIIDRIVYSNIQAGQAQVTISHIWSRPGGCVSTWTGVMKRD